MGTAGSQNLTGPSTAGAIPIATKFFIADTTSNFSNFRVRTVIESGNFNFNFVAPSDFGTLTSVLLILSPTSGASGSGKDIDLSSEYGALNEPANQHSEADTGTTYDFTGLADNWISIDLSGVLSSLSAGDFCGINVNNNSVGGSTRVLGIELQYIRN